MAVVKNLMVRAGADFSELEKELNKAQKTLKNAGKELSSIGKSLTLGLTVPIVAAGTASFKLAADMEDAMGGADQIFGRSAEEMKSWAKNLDSYYGIAAGEALEYGNMMGSMLQNIGGLTEDEAAKQSQTLIKLAGDLTAMYGGTTQDAVRALTGALKGNNTMLDNYGMAVNVAMVKTKAMEMGLYDGTGQMSLAAKQAATLALIMEQTGAAQGQAAREADGASGSLRTMVTELKNLATSFGEILLPTITPFISKINELIKRFGALDEGTKSNIVTFALYLAALGPVISIVGNLTTKVSGLIGAFKNASKALSAGEGFIGALKAMIGPAGLVVIAIAAVIAIGVLLWKNWDKISAFLKKTWEGIKSIAITVWTAIKNFFTNLWNGIKDLFIGVWNGILDFFKSVLNKINDFVTNFVKSVKEKWESVWNGVKDFFKGIWDGIVGAVEDSVNWIIKAVNKVISWINKIPGVDIKAVGSVDWTGANIEKHADGGIFTRPTMWGNHLIGEAGAEALVPLDRLAGAGMANIIVELDGYTLAKAMGQPLADIIRVKTGLKI